MPPTLDWLPALGLALRGLTAADAASWQALAGHARTRLDGLGLLQVDRCLQRLFGHAPPPGLTSRPVRLALLGSSTLDHLVAGLRVGGLRHGLWLDVRKGDYGSLDLPPDDEMPSDTALLLLDARHLLAGLGPGLDREGAAGALDAACDRLAGTWRALKDAGLAVLQQTLLPVFPLAFGNNEHRLPGSRAAAVAALNARLRVLAEAEGIDLVAVDEQAARDGLAAWHDPVLWHRAKQEIHHGAAPMLGELVGRLLAARQGRSRKALVLDLDNTLWGGVVGDDGVEGLVLGQGSAPGEAFVEVQAHAKGLAQRGVILAVCSKNDPAVAAEAFARHPDMLLRREDIACFVANWDDKATNLRRIAADLSIGLDALVFLDDNPAERAIIRRELPEVAVPDLPDDPTHYPSILAAAGYFEGVSLSAEDRARTALYRADAARAGLAPAAQTDMAGYLQSLDMVLRWGPVDAVAAPRVVQLVNKTNQFNLTTRRTTDAAVAAAMADPAMLALQFRLIDRFGDNGLIAVVMGRREGEAIAVTDWLMSCRVLKREVEAACLAVLAGEARRLGGLRLRGEYRPTPKNAMVRDHYERLGFRFLGEGEDGATLWDLDLDRAGLRPPPMRIEPPLAPSAEPTT